jgi:GNAT superfamily N-acetyltransferase
MFKVEKIEETNKQRMIDFLKSDIIRHVFAFYDIQYDSEHTTMYAAFEDGEFKGYVLIYTATDVPSVILECEVGAAETLLARAPKDHFILHTSPSLLPAVQREFPEGRDYVEDWMLVKKGQADFFKSEFVRKLSTEDDASGLGQLISSREDRPKRALKRYVEWISRMPMHGVFLESRLVSYAGSFLQLPQVWMIGGVYTHPEFRNKGYATLAVSAITQEALEQSEAAALFVRADNCPAVKAYEKIGYRKIGEKVWVDMGTGLRP